MGSTWRMTVPAGLGRSVARLLTGSLVLACALIRPASALIVYNGKVVDAWPQDAVQTWTGPGPGALGKSAAAVPHYYPHPSGTVWGLTLLVDFPDQPPAFTKDEIDAWLNQKGFNRFGCKGSVRDYY